MSQPIRVCYFGTYRASYSRNVIMMEGLRRAGVELTTCHVPLWQGIEDRVETTKGGWKRPSFWWRIVRTYARLIAKYRRTDPFDVLVVGYPGQIDVYLARVLARWSRKPLVWDVFMSLYLVALERGLDADSKFTVNLLRWVERQALRLPDRLVHDTEDYVNWLCKTHGLKPDAFRLVPTGADNNAFMPREHPETDQFRVVYYGTYIPNHAVEKIIEAAQLISEIPEIRIEMIGDGPERAAAEAKVRELALSSVAFLGWMEKDALVRHVSGASVILGAFGETPQSLMTVQNKIFEGLAMGRPVLSGQSQAVARVLTHKEHIYLCERTGAGIAEGLRELHADEALRERLATEGRRIFDAEFDLDSIGRRYRAILEEVLENRRG